MLLISITSLNYSMITLAVSSVKFYVLAKPNTEELLPGVAAGGQIAAALRRALRRARPASPPALAHVHVGTVPGI